MPTTPATTETNENTAATMPATTCSVPATTETNEYTAPQSKQTRNTASNRPKRGRRGRFVCLSGRGLEEVWLRLVKVWLRWYFRLLRWWRSGCVGVIVCCGGGGLCLTPGLSKK